MSGTRPGAMRFSAGVVLTVVATVAIAAVAYGGASLAFHRAAARASAPTPAPESAAPPVVVPSTAPTQGVRLVVRDAYALSASSAWVLVTDCIPPMTAQCGSSIASTANGGRTWSPAVQVGPSFDSGDGDAPRSVRFVNRLDGFVNGPGGAYVTHDSGATWHRSGLPAAYFGEIAVEGGTAWAVTNPCGKGIECRWEVRSSPDGGRSWSVSHSLPSGFSPFDVVAFKSGVLISSVPFGDMEITADGGTTWRMIKSACAGSPFRGFVATSDGRALWEACMGYPDQTGEEATKTLFVSHDGGKSWSAREGTALPASGVSVVLVSNRPRTAFVGTDLSQVSVTRDDGATWHTIGFGSAFSRLMFSTPDAGWALDASSNLWTTRDGGGHWARMGAYIPPA